MAGIRLSSSIRLHYLKKLFGQSVHVLDSMSPGYAINTITSTSNTLQLGISEKLGVFFEYNATIIAALVVAFHANWKLSLVVISVVVFIVLTVAILMPFTAKINNKMSQVSVQSSLKTFSYLSYETEPFVPRRTQTLLQLQVMLWLACE